MEPDAEPDPESEPEPEPKPESEPNAEPDDEQAVEPEYSQALGTSQMYVGPLSSPLQLKMLDGRRLPWSAETQSAGKLEEVHHTQRFAGAQEACVGGCLRGCRCMHGCVHGCMGT